LSESRVLCPESLRVQANLDGQLDAVTAAELERHMYHCAECRALHQGLEKLRAALRRDLPYAQAPRALRTQVTWAIDEASAADTLQPTHLCRTSGDTRQFWVGAISGGGTIALVAILAFWLLAPPLTSSVVDELLRTHVNSLLSTHLVDVGSTDQHGMKPWFAGQTDVSPVVADFEPQGYKLVGGRVDYLEHQHAVALVYRRGPHVINVFSWAATRRSLPIRVTRNGYHLTFWKVGDLQYCAISDAAWNELLGLVRLLQDLGARDARQ
jgi:anti-sigma factor RsiW